jgi:hypothetical protein
VDLLQGDIFGWGDVLLLISSCVNVLFIVSLTCDESSTVILTHPVTDIYILLCLYVSYCAVNVLVTWTCAAAAAADTAS